ncbi:MAG: hypothetical protein RR440_00265 [Erysipelotrichaceae bacterium]
MASYTFQSSRKFEPFTVSSSVIVDFDYAIERSGSFTMNPIEATSTYSFISDDSTPVHVISFDLYNLKLLFSNKVVNAKFELNGEIINEMLVNEREFNYAINPSFLKDGVNTLSILTEDTEEVVEAKVLEINKSLVPNNLSSDDLLNIKGNQYKVISVVDDVVTLDKELASNVSPNTFIEKPIFTITPMADLTFYNESPTYKSMKFVKSVYLDGMIEDSYELDSLLGDILYTRIDIERVNINDNVSISNVEYILIPDEG